MPTQRDPIGRFTKPCPLPGLPCSGLDYGTARHFRLHSPRAARMAERAEHADRAGGQTKKKSLDWRAMATPTTLPSVEVGATNEKATREEMITRSPSKSTSVRKQTAEMAHNNEVASLRLPSVHDVAAR